ncbi:MAG TPA: thiamine-phosphate kinase [Anaeromyxobacteraceae bacterium]|nr:thiamine-phosphate kinase [Anaeromyxobacteraceae bacterium]
MSRGRPGAKAPAGGGRRPARTVGEFELIERFTRGLPPGGEGVRLGIGDDAAVVEAPRGERLLLAVDAVVEGVHFRRGWAPEDVGWKALAVNLSDLAAMGGRPLWALAALAVPRGRDPAWLVRVGRGLAACARRYRVAVVGGNVTRARDLSLTVAVVGAVRRPLTRSGARPGDAVMVSGTLGDAALGLAPGAPPALAARQRRPRPRLDLGRALCGIATACIDVSDGLVQDLGHLCRASGVGASLRLAELPLSPAYQTATRRARDPWAAALSGGEDYELLCTVPVGRLGEALAAAHRAGERLSVVGSVVAGRGVQVARPGGGRYRPRRAGYDQLRSPAAGSGLL